MEDHWLTSDVDLKDGMAAELDEYLLDAFPPDTYFLLESLHIVMHDNNGQANDVSYLRQQDNDMTNGQCDLTFDISGQAIFVPEVTTAAFSPSNAPTALRQNITDGRFLIYSTVANALAKTLTILSSNATDVSTTTVAPPTTTTRNSTISPPLDVSVFPCRDSVQGPFRLNEGDFVCSPSGLFKFGLTPNGDLALSEASTSKKVWSAGTCCTGQDVITVFQRDANLVVYEKSSHKVVWGAKISIKDAKNASLVVGDDGVVAITDTIRGDIWSTTGV